MENACPQNMTCLTDILILGRQAVRASPKFWCLLVIFAGVAFSKQARLVWNHPNVIMRLLGHDWLRWSHFTSRCTSTPSSPLIWFPLAQFCVLPHAKSKIYVLVSEMILQPDQFVFHHYGCVHHCSVAFNPKRYQPLNPLRSNLKIGWLNRWNQISSTISPTTIMFTWWSS